MKNRQSTSAYYRAEERGTGAARHDVNDWFRPGGEHFWHAVWKRIERSQPRRAGGRRMRAMPLEAPRDYVVDNEVRA